MRIFVPAILAVLLCACAAERKSVSYDPDVYYRIKQKQQEEKNRREEYKKEGLVTKEFLLEYGTVQEMTRQIEKIMSPRGHLEVDAVNRSVTVTDEPRVFEGVENLLKELD